MIQTIEKLPDSPAKDFYLKDFLKGTGLMLLFIFSDAIPNIWQFLTDTNLGKYEFFIKAGFFCVAWGVQRYLKNNTNQYLLTTNSYENKIKESASEGEENDKTNA